MPSQSLGDALTKANPNNLADALRMVNLGQFLQPVQQTLVLGAEPLATIVLDPPAWGPAGFVAYATVAGGATGTYVATPGPSTPASATAVGACQLNIAGNEVTFPDLVSQVTLSYFAAPATSLESSFAFASP